MKGEKHHGVFLKTRQCFGKKITMFFFDPRSA